jgi:hypothetical protein
MEILNPGHVLPFYANKKSKMRYRAGCKEFNWAIPVDQGKSLSFQLPVDAALPGDYSMELLDENEDFHSSPVSDFLLYSEDADGNAWITVTANISFLTALDCGVYSIRILNDRGGAVAYSEDFRVMQIDQSELAYKIVFRNTTDIDGILYQGGYEQTVWILNAVFDTPDIVQPTENATDGDAIERLVFQSVQRREVLRFPYFPDFWQGVFHRFRMISNIYIVKLETSEAFDIADTGIDFATEEQDYCFKKGILSWISSTQVMVGCEENKEMVYLNNSPI